MAGNGNGEGERLQQWQACGSIVRASAAQCLHGNVVGVGEGAVGVWCVAVLVRRRQGLRGMEGRQRRRVCDCIVRVVAAFLGHEGSGGCGSVGAPFLGQKSSVVRLRKRSDNQHVVGVGMW